MNHFINELKNNKLFICYLCISIIVSLLFTVSIYKSTLNDSVTFNNISNSNNTSINQFINELTSINNSIDNCMGTSGIDINSSSTTLTSAISSLQTLKEKISLLDISSNEDTSVQTSLTSSIDSTINLYSYLLNCISSTEKPTPTDFSSTTEQLQTDCNTNYSNLLSYGYTLELPDSVSNFITLLANYFSTLDALNKQQTIETEQIETFITNIKTTINNFSNLIENLEPAILSIRNENRSFAVLLEDLNNKSTTFENLKKQFNSYSIPDGYLEYYSNINDLFTCYSSYLNLIKTAVIYEQSTSNYESNKTTIDSNYTLAFNKLDTVQSLLDDINKSLENL